MRADDPIRSELLIEAQKSIRFPYAAALLFITRIGGSETFAGGDAVDQSIADLSELRHGAALHQTGLPIAAEMEIRAARFLASKPDQVSDVERSATGFDG